MRIVNVAGFLKEIEKMLPEEFFGKYN
jgi:hypothetical protein